MADDVFVRETDNETITRGVVFVFGLFHHAFTGIVVGFTETTTLVFGLETLEVSFVLLYFNEGHGLDFVWWKYFFGWRGKECDTRYFLFHDHNGYIRM